MSVGPAEMIRDGAEAISIPDVIAVEIAIVEETVVAIDAI